MGGGMLQLIAYSSQDYYLTGNPQITYFKTVYRRHTNFSMESIKQTINGKKNIDNSGINNKGTVVVSKNGDLLCGGHVKCVIANNEFLKTYGICGDNLIEDVELEIGGQRIDKHYKEWNQIFNELTIPKSKADGFKYMTGSFSNSIVKNNQSYIMYPLNFWFCRNKGLALPLIALQFHEIILKFTWGDGSFNHNNKKAPNNIHRKEGWTETIGKDELGINTGLKYDPPSLEVWLDYIYLDTDERRRFSQVSHEYLIEQLQIQKEKDTLKSNFILNLEHPVKEIIWTTPTPNNYTNVVGIDDKKIHTELNGHERFSPQYKEYFMLQQPYEHHTSIPAYNIKEQENPTLLSEPLSICAQLQVNENNYISIYNNESDNISQSLINKENITLFKISIKDENQSLSIKENVKIGDIINVEVIKNYSAETYDPRWWNYMQKNAEGEYTDTSYPFSNLPHSDNNQHYNNTSSSISDNRNGTNDIKPNTENDERLNDLYKNDIHYTQNLLFRNTVSSHLYITNILYDINNNVTALICRLKGVTGPHLSGKKGKIPGITTTYNYNEITTDQDLRNNIISSGESYEINNLDNADTNIHPSIFVKSPNFLSRDGADLNSSTRHPAELFNEKSQQEITEFGVGPSSIYPQKDTDTTYKLNIDNNEYNKHKRSYHEIQLFQGEQLYLLSNKRIEIQNIDKPTFQLNGNSVFYPGLYPLPSKLDPGTNKYIFDQTASENDRYAYNYYRYTDTGLSELGLNEENIDGQPVNNPAFDYGNLTLRSKNFLDHDMGVRTLEPDYYTKSLYKWDGWAYDTEYPTDKSLSIELESPAGVNIPDGVTIHNSNSIDLDTNIISNIHGLDTLIKGSWINVQISGDTIRGKIKDCTTGSNKITLDVHWFNTDLDPGAEISHISINNPISTKKISLKYKSDASITGGSINKSKHIFKDIGVLRDYGPSGIKGITNLDGLNSENFENENNSIRLKRNGVEYKSWVDFLAWDKIENEPITGDYLIRDNAKVEVAPRYPIYIPHITFNVTVIGRSQNNQSRCSQLQKDIYVYSFAINPEDHQPSGTCNFSKINSAKLILSEKANISNIYAVNYNILRISSGMAGLAYAN